MGDRDIYRVFEQVKPTRSQEEAMLERLFLEERKGRPMKLMKKTIAVLAAAALLLTTCAFAAVTGLGRQVLDYFGVRQEDEALFSQEWEPVGLSHTFQNGWTVDVNQMYTGLYSAAILVDVTAPEGVVLDGDNYSLKYWWEETGDPWPLRMGGGRPDYLPDGNSADGKVSFLITAVCLEDPASLLGLETKFYPYRLTEYSEGVEETFDFVGGHWTTDLTITLSEQASGFVQPVRFYGIQSQISYPQNPFVNAAAVHMRMLFFCGLWITLFCMVHSFGRFMLKKKLQRLQASILFQPDGAHASSVVICRIHILRPAFLRRAVHVAGSSPHNRQTIQEMKASVLFYRIGAYRASLRPFIIVQFVHGIQSASVRRECEPGSVLRLRQTLPFKQFPSHFIEFIVCNSVSIPMVNGSVSCKYGHIIASNI